MYYIIIGGLLLAGCATSTPVMDAGDGIYMVSARAAPARGGATGAQTVAYEEAQKFCAQKGGRPVIVGTQDRDIYQSAIGGGWSQGSGSFGGSSAAGGSASLRFRCNQ